MNLPPNVRPPKRVDERLTFLAGGGEMGERIRSFDWEANPLGPPEHWPQSLKTSVRIMLASRQPIWIGWGEDLIYLYNDPYKAIIGGKHPRMLGEPTRIVWEEIWPEIAHLLAKAMQGDEGTYVESQLLIMERSGYPEETYYTFSYTPIPDDEGKPGGIICANTDDTQRVIGERQQSQLRELAAATAESRNIEDCCTICAKSLADDPEDLPFAMIYVPEKDGQDLILAGSVGLGEGHLLAPPTLPAKHTLWPVHEVMESGQSQVVELTGLTDIPRGPWPIAPLLALVAPISAPGEPRVRGLLVAGLNPYRLLDASYRGFLLLIASQIGSAMAGAAAYEEERRRVEALAELDRAKTAFFSNISHEFRTPLTLMLAPMEEVLAKSEQDILPDNRALVGLAHGNALRLLKLVNTLLDFTRLEAGRTKLNLLPVDLGALTSELAAMFDSATDRVGLKLSIDSPPLNKAVLIDPEMWEKIVLNLVSNAFKFTFEGEIKVSLLADETEEKIFLRVSDTGTGIPEKELPNLFKRFYRVQGAVGRTQEGTGIGLSLAQEFAKLHSGTISVESKLGKGTTFTVEVPLLHADGATDPDGRQGLSPKTAAPFADEAMRMLPEAFDNVAAVLIQGNNGSDDSGDTDPDIKNAKARILLADDNPEMRGYLKRLLAEERYEVVSVGDGAAALNSAKERRPDLVLTDMMMPVMDGFALIAALRADTQLADLPVIVLSARAGEESRVEGLEHGADDYLVKPFSARELIARVESTLSLSRLRSELHAQQREADELLRQRLEVEVQNRTRELMQANEQLQGFTYSVAHDLRQQIRGISTNSALLLNDAEDVLDGENLHTLERLIESAKSLSALVDELLKYARLGQLEPKRVPLDISSITKEVVGILAERGVCGPNIKISVAPGLKAKADPTMLKLVLQNLLDNALKYCKNREAPLIEVGKEGDAFFVKDNGVGFNMAYSSRLFQPFERLHASSEYGGTGIGLANVRRIVEKHGGKIWADAEEEKGATFYFTLAES